MQNQAALRKNRFEAIRNSLKENPVIKTNTMALQNKIQKRRKRRQSVQFDQNLTQSQKQVMLEVEDISVKGTTKFEQKYTLGDKIGQGSDGYVKMCYLKSTNQVFAVKAMKMDDEHMIFLKKNFRDISSLDHPNIIKYRNMFLDLKNHTCNLVMDYENNPNLLEHKDLEPEQVKIIMQQLLDTVAYIHSQKICHRDIKPQNILYDRDKRLIKLVDFGISKKFQNRSNKNQMLTITGTLFYQAPEIFLGGGYDEKVDVWAVGITFYQLVTGRTPFQSENSGDVIRNIEKGTFQISQQIWDKYGKAARDLLYRLLLKKRAQRLTAGQAKKHFWFNKRPSNNIDLSKSDSLNFKLGQGVCYTTNKEYAQDADQSRSTKKIPILKVDLKKKFICQSSDSDSLIQIESQNEDEIESPSNSPGKLIKPNSKNNEEDKIIQLKMVQGE